MSLLAIDVGSSACKAVVFSADGEILAQHAVSYTPEFPSPGFAETDPEKFWNAVCVCCRSVTQELKDPVRALGLSSHGETFVPVDSRGEPVTNAVLNQDNRAIFESNWCEETIGREVLFQVTGLIAHPMYPIPKILWMRKHAPKLFSASKSFITVIGFLLHKMGLPPLVDYSLASRFLAFDIHRRSWSDEILAAAELDKALLPNPVPAGTIVGKLNAETAGNLGLRSGIPIVLGGHDQPCSALGCGVIEAGRVSGSLGTYECIVACSDAPCLNSKALAASLNSYCHVVPDKFVTLAYFPSGIMVKWFHDLLYPRQEDESTGDSERTHYAAFEARVRRGPTGLCITPHLIGTCNPDFNPHARSVISGLSSATSSADLYKGILEGVACELSIVAGTLAEAIGRFEDIYVTGGGVRSTLGLQLRAALTGCRLHVMSTQEAACLGTAILAGVAVGEYADIPQAVASIIKENRVVAPDPSICASYRHQLTRYRDLRSAAVHAGSYEEGN